MEKNRQEHPDEIEILAMDELFTYVKKALEVRENWGSEPLTH